MDARVLILADPDLAAACADGLDRLGWRAIIATNPAAAVAAVADLKIETVLVEPAVLGDDAEAWAARMRAACWPRGLPIASLGASGADAAYDLRLPARPHPAQTALRLEQLVRAAVAREEFELRAETFQERSARLERPTEPGRPVRILAVGDPAPEFLALSNALDRAGSETIAAFTAYTAFDYLHEKPFDGVVLWGGDRQADALTIAAGMRRNTRLHHVPVTLYLRSTEDLNESDAFSRGVTDVADPRAPIDETAAMLMAHARAYRRQSAIRTALENIRGSGLMDKSTGLFTRDLFASHLTRLAEASRRRNRPLSVCVLKLGDRPDVVRARSGGWLDRAMPQIGSMISRLVRAEDTAARLAPEVFALALPATRLSQARVVCDRIGAVIGCTAFDAGSGQAPFVAEFDMGMAEVSPSESAARALERASASLRSLAS